MFIEKDKLVTQVCTKCGDPKKLSDFGKDERRKDGIITQCKDCTKEHHLDWYYKNKEEHNKKAKEYKNNHLEQYKEYGRVYYQTNKKEISDRMKEYYQSTKELRKAAFIL
jgi:hypothetical protein